MSIVIRDCRLIYAQQYRSILLTTLHNTFNKTLFNPIFINSKQVVHLVNICHIVNYNNHIKMYLPYLQVIHPHLQIVVHKTLQ